MPKPFKKVTDAARAARLLVWDTETTGLTLHPEAKAHLQPRVIEFGFAMLSLDDGSVLERDSKLIHPGHAIPAEITKITGITDAGVVHEANFSERYRDIRKVFDEANAMVAHNLPFDKAIMEGELTRIGPNCLKEFPWPVRQFCTVGIFREEYGFNPKLTLLYEDKIGKPLAQTHRALGDVDALVEIIQTTKNLEDDEMSNATDKAQAQALALMMKGMVTELPAEERAKFVEAKAALEAVIEKYGDMGGVALVIVTAEWTDKE